MELTNKHNLPEPLYRAVQAREADYAGTHTRHSDISVTQLIDSPRRVALTKTHWGELTEDASDRIWALMGSTIHKILEEYDDDLTEERLYKDIGGWTVSGQYDRIVTHEGLMQDYKMCSVWESIYGLKAEREQQLNCLAHLAILNGHDLSRLEIVSIYRDWQQSRALREADYPQSQVEVHPIAFWPFTKRQAFMEGRVLMHQQALEALPECSGEDRWSKADVFAVMKDGRKSAVKLHDNHASAMTHAQSDKSLTVVVRPGENTRCDKYCAVADYCDQYKALRGVTF